MSMKRDRCELLADCLKKSSDFSTKVSSISGDSGLLHECGCVFDTQGSALNSRKSAGRVQVVLFPLKTGI